MGFADFESKQKFINKEVSLENTLDKWKVLLQEHVHMT